MVWLRISFVFCCLLGLVASAAAEEKKPAVNKAFDAEVTATTDAVMQYTDTDANGSLSQLEAKTAKSQVIESMIAKMPRAGYIAGGEVSLQALRQKLSQQALDMNADKVIDKTELGNYIGFAIAEREKTVRLPYSTQFALTMEQSKGEVMRYTWQSEAEQRKRDQWKWHAKAVQQRQETWFEVQARLRAVRAQADREIAESRAKADQEAIRRENSPGLKAGEEPPKEK